MSGGTWFACAKRRARWELETEVTMSIQTAQNPGNPEIATPLMAHEEMVSQRRWVVMSAGVGINMALGVLYTWSMFKDAISKEFGWKGEQLNDPRIGAGLLSDKIGRRWTLMLVLLFQGMLMFAAIPVASAQGTAPWLIVLVATLIGFNYGANLSLFPSYTKDLWGLKGFGVNYGILFTAWGVGGLVWSRLQQMLTSHSGGSFSSSFAVAGMVLLGGAALTLALKPATKTG